MRNFASIDFETTNYNRLDACRLGIVIVSEIIEKRHCLIRPQPNFYCSWATSIHGLSYYDTLKEPESPEIWEDIIAKIEVPLVAHNSDTGCLKAVHDLYRMQYPSYIFLCTYHTEKKEYPNLVNHQLHTIANTYWI